MYVCVYVCTWVCKYTCLCAHMCVHVCVCLCVYMCMCECPYSCACRYTCEPSVGGGHKCWIIWPGVMSSCEPLGVGAGIKFKLNLGPQEGHCELLTAEWPFQSSAWPFWSFILSPSSKTELLEPCFSYRFKKIFFSITTGQGKSITTVNILLYIFLRVHLISFCKCIHHFLFPQLIQNQFL